MKTGGILITGASGLLGANLVLETQHLGKPIVAVYHNHKLVNSSVVVLQADLTQANVTVNVLKAKQPEWIIHCAALTDIEWCQNHRAETYQVNVEMPKHLARAARQIGAKMVYISTDSVFDGQQGHYSETDPPNPVNLYAKSKLAGERAVQAELESALIIRTNIYGWNAQPKPSLAEWIFNRLQQGQAVPGFEDVIFSPILVNDLAKLILEMMDNNLTGVYHVGGLQYCSKYEFAVKLAEVFSFNSELIQPVSIDSSELKTPRPKNTSLNTGKVSQALDWQMPALKLGLQNLKTLRDRGFVAQLKTLTGA